MFNEIIHKKAKLWLASPECKVKSVVEYIRKAERLREPQIEAIEVYLFLKIAGENKPLWQLLNEGFFSTGVNLAKLDMAVDARKVFEESVSARSIFEFVRTQSGNTTSELSANEKLIARKATEINFEEVAKHIFYGADYNDYLFSLPMGAGKTFLMAAMMYLDLYFATNEPNNKLFAHNFLILVPSGLKSSIVPSLKTIERFDPLWVIPEPAASNLKRLIKFEILDEAKSAKKSNKAKNPNVQKIARHQPFEDLMGLIAVVNAEKVILDRLELDKTGHLFERTADEKDALANELRNFIGKIPNLQIHIDEYHHVPPTKTGNDASSGLSAQHSVLASARAFHADSAPHEALFIEYGLGRNFRADLTTLIDAIETASSNADSSEEAKAAATGGLRDAAKRGMDISRRLNSIVRIKYAENPQKLAAWTVASHLEKAPSGPTPTPPTP